ncbi:hypothetical protein [Knoellia subterranea]|uniref:Lipoprotein n=1 Tax=Knoellia subterranea KCTC 19937 TaxID=1385521 RepID=A0A0A0JLF7_9MICO|nr:hypothetical protein [Knoellia subterranea]KGN37569.1 hypothetical protein N803_13555 [Knoellia subterranea KCTC 19937]
MKGRALGAAVATLVAFATTSCAGGGSDDSTGSADGWTKVTVGQLTLERPSDWTEEAPTGEKWTKRFVGDGVELQVAGEFSEDPTASAALSRLDLPAMVGLENYDGGGATKVDVKGADTAVRSDFTFSDAGTAKKGVWLIAGQYPYPRTSAVSITGSSLEDSTVAHIVESLSYEKKNS